MHTPQQPLRQVSPPIFGSLHHRQAPNLLELDELAQRSVMKRLRSNDAQRTEPTFRDIPRKIFGQQQKHKEQISVKKTKQPSLPYLPKKHNEYYNKWYIPYDQRYVHKPEVSSQQYEDELHFYKNMHNMYVEYNPFENKLPEELLKHKGYKERSDAVKEILKGQKQIIEFKRSLEKQQQRVPAFIQQLITEEQLNKKQKHSSFVPL